MTLVHIVMPYGSHIFYHSKHENIAENWHWDRHNSSVRPTLVLWIDTYFKYMMILIVNFSGGWATKFVHHECTLDSGPRHAEILTERTC